MVSRDPPPHRTPPHSHGIQMIQAFPHGSKLLHSPRALVAARLGVVALGQSVDKLASVGRLGSHQHLQSHYKVSKSHTFTLFPAQTCLSFTHIIQLPIHTSASLAYICHMMLTSTDVPPPPLRHFYPSGYCLRRSPRRAMAPVRPARSGGKVRGRRAQEGEGGSLEVGAGMPEGMEYSISQRHLSDDPPGYLLP